MRILFVSILSVLLFSQCQHKSKRILFDYVNTDSIVHYKIYHDSLVLDFPDKTRNKKWLFEIEITSSDTLQKEFPLHISGNGGYAKVYTVVNNRIVVPLSISDSIDLKKLKLGLLAGQPDDGIHFTQAYHYNYPKEKGWYELEGNQVFFQKDTFTLITAPYTREWKWFVVPDSLFKGKDSTFYMEQFVLFERDSMPHTNFSPQQ